MYIIIIGAFPKYPIAASSLFFGIDIKEQRSWKACNAPTKTKRTHRVTQDRKVRTTEVVAAAAI